MADDKKKEVKKESAKVSPKVEKLVEEISTLSVMDLSQLVNLLQDKLGISAQAPVMAAAPQAGVAPEVAQASQGGAIQTVVMTNAGANKINVIKALREINQNLTLMDAKAMTEQVPAEILKDAKAEDAKAAGEKLKAAGATVEIK